MMILCYVNGSERVWPAAGSVPKLERRLDLFGWKFRADVNVAVSCAMFLLKAIFLCYLQPLSFPPLRPLT